MRNLMRGIVGVLGLFNLLIGVNFLLNPAKMGADFFLTPNGIQGLATLRADFPGFFIGAALFALYGAWKGRAEPLMVPLVMLALAFAGRIVSLVLDGVAPTAFQPMIVEAVMMTILLVGYRAFGRASA